MRLWDPQTGQQHAVLEGHQGGVRAVCAFTVSGRPLLASGGETVRLWDPQTGQQHAVLEGHQDWVNAVCAITVSGRELLASGGDDETVRLWHPQTGACILTVPIHYQVLGAASVPDSLAIGLDTGILVIKLNPAALPAIL